MVVGSNLYEGATPSRDKSKPPMDVVITDDGDFDPHTTWGYGSQGVRDTELPNQTTNSLSVISWNCRGTISRGFGK